MQPKPSTKPAELTTRSTVPPSKVSLTPEQELKLRLKMEEIDKGIKEAFKNGLDLSGRETP